jgi:hypothetical protein
MTGAESNEAHRNAVRWITADPRLVVYAGSTEMQTLNRKGTTMKKLGQRLLAGLLLLGEASARATLSVPRRSS